MRDKYIEECAAVQQNCTYTAEAHHQMAVAAKRRALWLQTVPAIGAAISSALVAANVAAGWLLPLTVLSAATSAVGAILNPNKDYQDHLAAAKAFTALKHDARFLRHAEVTTMTEEAFAVAVQNLHRRYNEVAQATPATDEKSIEKAREKVQGGLHDLDRDNAGEVK